VSPESNEEISEAGNNEMQTDIGRNDQGAGAVPDSPPASETVSVSSDEYENALESLLTAFQGMSRNVIRSPREKLSGPLEELDYDEISKILGELVYQDPWDESEVVSILKELVSSSDSWVRYRAIEYLYRMGHGGKARTEATSMISASSFVENPAGGEEDLRITLANALGTYRDPELLPAFVELYKNTGSRRLRDDLMLISPDDGWEVIGGDVTPRASQTVMEWFGMAQVAEQRGFVEGVFRDAETDPETRNAAAWAMTRLGADTGAAEEIRNYARRAISDEPGRLSGSKSSVVYLGTLTDEESVSVLEDIARGSESGPVVDVATANLVINHRSRTSAGKDLIIEELTGNGTPLARELAITLAAYMSDDPEVRAAGEMSDRTGSVDSWEKGLARKEWAFWGWANEYLIVPPIE